MRRVPVIAVPGVDLRDRHLGWPGPFRALDPGDRRWREHRRELRVHALPRVACRLGDGPWHYPQGLPEPGVVAPDGLGGDARRLLPVVVLRRLPWLPWKRRLLLLA